MSTGTHNIFQFLVLALYLGISWAVDELTDDGLDSKNEEENMMSSPLLEDTTSAPSPSPVPSGGNERSIIILSWMIISVGIIVLTFFFWTMKTQIKDFIIKVSSLQATYRARMVLLGGQIAVFLVGATWCT